MPLWRAQDALRGGHVRGWLTMLLLTLCFAAGATAQDRRAAAEEFLQRTQLSGQFVDAAASVKAQFAALQSDAGPAVSPAEADRISRAIDAAYAHPRLHAALLEARGQVLHFATHSPPMSLAAPPTVKHGVRSCLLLLTLLPCRSRHHLLRHRAQGPPQADLSRRSESVASAAPALQRHSVQPLTDGLSPHVA